MHSGAMNAPSTIQGHPETATGSSQAVPGGLFSYGINRIAAFAMRGMLQRMHAGLEEGVLEGELPDGSPCILGGRAPGPVAIVKLNSWMGLWRVASGGSIGLYRAWEKGEWESPDPVQLFDLFVRNRVALGETARASGLSRLGARVFAWMRRNDKAGARRNIEFHYDLGNDFYREWLDQSLTYSSALFAQLPSDGEKLEDAQHRKIAALLDRLELDSNSNLLEIGCGWGSLAKAALARGIDGYHGITLSSEQKAFADILLQEYNDKASITLTDYRDIDRQYDAIASVEMVEAVGQEYWPDYINTISSALRKGGRAAIQYIRIEDDIFEAYANGADFIQAYIFPGGMLLSESRFRTLVENAGLEWVDQTDFGPHYAETLRRWRVQFDAAVADDRLPTHFDQKFIRLWRFYLMYCEGGFRGGGINVSQVTLIKNNG
jgi:cyclopropane-fatty-acyl-phospholipid synthase